MIQKKGILNQIGISKIIGLCTNRYRDQVVFVTQKIRTLLCTSLAAEIIQLIVAIRDEDQVDVYDIPKENLEPCLQDSNFPYKNNLIINVADES